MKRFSFSLARVLKLKEQRKRLAEQRQEQARAALDAARSVVAALIEELARNAVHVEGKLGQSTTPGEWLALSQHSVQLGRSLELAEAEVLKKLGLLREAAAQRTRAAREVEVLLHLRDKQLDQHWQETMHEDQLRLDELSMALWSKELP
jgi:flagellar export protein FliJ